MGIDKSTYKTNEALRDHWKTVIDEHDDVLEAKRVVFVDSAGHLVDVQHPVPADGDSAYEKDVSEEDSSLGTFTGKPIGHLFSDYHTEIKDETNNALKTFTIHFHRPIRTAQIVMGSIQHQFSNVKLILKGENENVIYTIDDSLNDTKYDTNPYDFPPIAFIELVVEFHTTDFVSVNGLFISKFMDVIALIQGVDDVTGLPAFGKFDNGEFIVGGKIGLKNSSQQNIDPATEQKQDSMITAIQGISGVTAYNYVQKDVGVTYTYYGFASETGWQFKRKTNATSIWEIATGTGDYDTNWTDRANKTYTYA